MLGRGEAVCRRGKHARVANAREALGCCMANLTNF